MKKATKIIVTILIVISVITGALAALSIYRELFAAGLAFFLMNIVSTYAVIIIAIKEINKIGKED